MLNPIKFILDTAEPTLKAPGSKSDSKPRPWRKFAKDFATTGAIVAAVATLAVLPGVFVMGTALYIRKKLPEGMKEKMREQFSI